VPILCTLQGDDIYLEALPAPYRAECLKLVRRNCLEIDGFIATSGYYADFMADYFGIPRQRIQVVYPGINLERFGQPRPTTPHRPFTIGYFARICPEKGFHLLTEDFRLLNRKTGTENCRLHASGWLGANNQVYFHDTVGRLKAAGLADYFQHVESPDHQSKVGFLQGIDVLSVPTVYREPKGLYVLEALANGVPVVQPRHGSFPELVQATGGGLLVQPLDAADLAEALYQLARDSRRAEELGLQGKKVVHQHFHAERMARETALVYSHYLS
jgi:glycosyltransferase involved in cell wall biosynthesis